MNELMSRLRVLDMSRVFSGPWVGQMFADFGADVIKVERPVHGDDTRHQGFRMRDAEGEPTSETSSFVAMNRGKRSITVDLAQPAGQALVRKLAAQCDVLIENFKAGDLERYGLGYEAMREVNPRLVYCSISGFGQTGPYSSRPGYDPIFQSMSGLMAMTGAPDGTPGAGPQKVGYAVSDLTAGFYAIAATLAALHHRDTVSGTGQHIDIALLDAQIGAISHMAQNWFASGRQPPRLGTSSEITCPYQAFTCSDGDVMVAVGNDGQFRKFCAAIGLPELAADQRFLTNPLRAAHRAELIALIAARLAPQPVRHWIDLLEAHGIPCGPINDFAQAFSDPQVVHREMRRTMAHPAIGEMPFVANPVKFSGTPVQYRRAPPLLGEHTDEILEALLGLDEREIAALREARTV
ncbi:crotonobetainyl-CoA:carnitine CoA-transferase CaiB-like acyl-CoA transferase [Paraburkholderia unamae]|uniref:CaiB/BaiF CoA transferase family protein n=1 Tax=Paraburkholderia unamae TaxID=219649 RepID=UPI000DC51A57|nr:CaiB/BaiF CoA-transferase family protein [Paraburkholderia unamae]RAR61240.1 crotonobetainyl-CoA:carnitine CoA-transferase CaiB-like acyl-CoA transferase [Paraburkholderia unamae]